MVSENRGTRRRPQKGPPKAEPREPLVNTSLGGDVPLKPEEVAEMQLHLEFFRRYRRVLRMKLNAKESLLIDGVKPPDHRGTCKKLLRKLDRSAITAALARDPLNENLKARAEFLAGAASISADLGILLDYLESLQQVSTRARTARAFTAAVDQIDFTNISAARLSRLLLVMQKSFDEDEQVQGLFSLLRSQSFMAAFDKCAESLTPEVRERFIPLRAVWDAISGRGGSNEALERGLGQLLSAPPEVLDAHPAKIRTKLVEAALDLETDWPPTHRGVHHILSSIPKDSGSFRSLAHRCASRLVRLGEDRSALALLDQLVKAHPAAAEAIVLQNQLQRRKIGRIAVKEVEAGPLRPGFCLRRMQPVYLVVGTPAETEVYRQSAEVHQKLCLPAVAGLRDSGQAEVGPYLAVSAGQPLMVDTLTQHGRSLSLAEVVAIAVDGARIAHALGQLGISLPDMRIERFLLERSAYRPALRLADLSGAHATNPEQALAQAQQLAAAWCFAALTFPPFSGRHLRRELPQTLVTALQEAQRISPPTVELVHTLLDWQ